jgi:hypothetical protein
MVQATSGIHSSSPANDIILNGTPSLGAADFAQQLMTAIEGLLQKSGNGSQLEIDITPSKGQNSASSQLTVTVKGITTPTSTTPPTTPAATPSTTQATPVTLMSSVTPTSTSKAASSSTPAAASTPALASAVDSSDVSNMTPDQAYWASQPAAVQALQTMSPDQRYYAAQQLATEGYTIDVPIMVDGLDPLATMMQRQADGYTWVPSALQANIPVGPGIMWPGPAYDPNNPPAGSIMVTTAFAAGTNMQDPWISKADITASLAGTSS